MKLLACVLILFSCGLAAQQAPTTAAAPAAGQVSGRVFCADTGQPARFASVQLVSDHPDANPALDASAMGKNPDFEKVLAKAMTAMMKGNNVSTVSGLDGSFTLDKVPPGTYYVLAQLAGYQSPLSQFSMMERMKADAATMKAVESLAEKIVVQPGQQAHVEVRLERTADGFHARVVAPDGLAVRLEAAPGLTTTNVSPTAGLSIAASSMTASRRRRS